MVVVACYIFLKKRELVHSMIFVITFSFSEIADALYFLVVIDRVQSRYMKVSTTN